jgi:hypothetical protein
MPRSDTITVRVSAAEREAIKALAERLQRSQSDAVRFVVREAVRELENRTGRQEEPEPQHAAA